MQFKSKKYSTLRVIAGSLFTLLWLITVLMIFTRTATGAAGWVAAVFALLSGVLAGANFRGARTGERVDWDAR
jgi:membrane associated rhomboid family serine protease